MSNIIYYNAKNNKFIGVPVMITEELIDILPTPTE